MYLQRINQMKKNNRIGIKLITAGLAITIALQTNEAKFVSAENVTTEPAETAAQTVTEETQSWCLSIVSASVSGLSKLMMDMADSYSEEVDKVLKEMNEEAEDVDAPMFLVFNGSPSLKPGEEFDIHKYIGYADDVDRDVTLEVSGSVDTSTEGTYPLKITITDDAGHSTSRDMNVRIATPAPNPDGGDKKFENFSDFRSQYKTDETSVGIDISRWQEAVDFEKVKAAGCEFVYMRIGGLDDGELYTDRYYLNNMAGAKAAGMQVGIYWHAEESSPAEVRESVRYMMEVLADEQLDFPIAYDWEDFKNFENYGMNIHDLNKCLQIFEEEVSKYGYKACLYGSKNYLETVWTGKKLYPVWLAHYTKSTSYAGDYFMWQHSCIGKIEGVKGDVDLDVLYRNRMSNAE